MHQVEHLPRRAAVEVARGLVGQHAPGLGDERARKRHKATSPAGAGPVSVPGRLLLLLAPTRCRQTGEAKAEQCE